jgi:opacity protein-like surface antigen
MKKSLFAFIALAALAIPSISQATPPRMGPYVSGFVGVTIPDNTDSTAFNLNDRVQFDPGVNIGGTGGFDFGYMRLEGELSYKRGRISRVSDRISGDTFTSINDRGGLGVLAVLGNVFVDLHNQSPITPYIGGGAGFATIHQEDTSGRSTSTGIRTDLYRSDDDTVFAYQVGAGVDMALTRMLSLDVGYRYFGTSLAHFNPDTSLENDLRFKSHNVTVGIRVKF